MRAEQFAAGLVQGVELLLLLHLGGDVPAKADELLDLSAHVLHGREVQLDVAVIAAVEPGGGPLAGQGRVKGTVVGAEDLRRAERVVEAPARDGAAAPALERGVGPEDAQVGTDHRHPVGQRFENAPACRKLPMPWRKAWSSGSTMMAANDPERSRPITWAKLSARTTSQSV